MKVFDFSIIASGLHSEADDFADHFFNAGCDDATLSFQKGHIILDFAREADSFEDAVASAISNVLAAGAHVDRIEPDPLVSLSEIASRSQMSRAAMTQYSKGQRGKGFPAPIARVTSDSPLWDWPTVACWLHQHQKLSHETVVEAVIVRIANDELQAGRVPSGDLLKQRAAGHEGSLEAECV